MVFIYTTLSLWNIWDRNSFTGVQLQVGEHVRESKGVQMEQKYCMT